MIITRPNRPPRKRPPRDLRRRRTVVRQLGLATLSGLLVAAASVYVGTSAATSTATTGNGPTTVQAGQVSLTDDDADSALYTLGSTPLDAGQQLPERCIAVTYNGNWSGPQFDSAPLTSFDASKFSVPYRPEDVSVANGELKFATTQANTVRAWLLNGGAGEHFNFRQTSFQAQLVQRSGDGQTSIELWKDGDTAQIVWYSSNVSFHIFDDGAHYEANLSYDPVAMKYVRFLGRGQQLRLQYSADALIWATALDKNPSFDLSDVALAAGTTRWDGGVTTAVGSLTGLKVAPTVKIRLSAATSGDLAPYLHLTIQRGTGGSTANCAGFSPQASVYTGTLAAMPTSFEAAGPTGQWNPSSSTETSTYRITGLVADNAGAAAANAIATFTWSAHAGD